MVLELLGIVVVVDLVGKLFGRWRLVCRVQIKRKAAKRKLSGPPTRKRG
jgi:hypothetical protein